MSAPGQPAAAGQPWTQAGRGRRTDEPRLPARQAPAVPAQAAGRGAPARLRGHPAAPGPVHGRLRALAGHDLPAAGPAGGRGPGHPRQVDGRKVYRITDKGRAETRRAARTTWPSWRRRSPTRSGTSPARCREDVRDTVRNLREELTWTAREGRDGGARDADREAAREQARRAREEVKDSARRARRELLGEPAEPEPEPESEPVPFRGARDRRDGPAWPDWTGWASRAGWASWRGPGGGAGGWGGGPGGPGGLTPGCCVTWSGWPSTSPASCAPRPGTPRRWAPTSCPSCARSWRTP